MENIVEYTRKLPFQPEQTMYTVKFRSREYHSDTYETVVNWLAHQKAISIIEFRRSELIRDKAIISFFENTTTSKD